MILNCILVGLFGIISVRAQQLEGVHDELLNEGAQEQVQLDDVSAVPVQESLQPLRLLRDANSNPFVQDSVVALIDPSAGFVKASDDTQNVQIDEGTNQDRSKRHLHKKWGGGGYGWGGKGGGWGGGGWGGGGWGGGGHGGGGWGGGGGLQIAKVVVVPVKVVSGGGGWGGHGGGGYGHGGGGYGHGGGGYGHGGWGGGGHGGYGGGCGGGCGGGGGGGSYSWSKASSGSGSWGK